MRCSTEPRDSVAEAAAPSASVEHLSSWAHSSARPAVDLSAGAHRFRRALLSTTNDALPALWRALGSRSGILPGVRHPPADLGPRRPEAWPRIEMDNPHGDRRSRCAGRRRGRGCRGRRLPEQSRGHHRHRRIRHRACIEHAPIVDCGRPVGNLGMATRRRWLDRCAHFSASDRRSTSRACPRPQGTGARTLTSRRARLVSVREPAPWILDRVHGCLRIRGRSDERARGCPTLLTRCGRTTGRLVMACCRCGRHSSRTL